MVDMEVRGSKENAEFHVEDDSAVQILDSVDGVLCSVLWDHIQRLSFNSIKHLWLVL